VLLLPNLNQRPCKCTGCGAVLALLERCGWLTDVACATVFFFALSCGTKRVLAKGGSPSKQSYQMFEKIVVSIYSELERSGGLIRES
jgi:hypothetical protein